MTTDSDILIGLRAVARYLNRSERHTRRLWYRHGMPIAKLGRKIYSSKIAIAFFLERVASEQRAHRAAIRAATRRAPEAALDDVVRAHVGAAIREQLASRVAATGSPNVQPPAHP